MKTDGDQRRRLPSVDVLLRETALQPLLATYGRTLVVDAAREELARARESWNEPDAPTVQDLVLRCGARLKAGQQPSMRRVLNLTGTVIHTNLGRAVMPQCAVDAVAQAMANPVNLEFEIEEGGRGERDDHIESLLTRLTGAEAALAVNNNAAAVVLVLNTLALGREVPVSRGELVEIGGAFRVPDIMKRSGVTLVEVGTTNRTHPKDYESAIGKDTAALMKVHTSNYRVEGFTAVVSETTLAEIAHRHELPLSPTWVAARSSISGSSAFRTSPRRARCCRRVSIWSLSVGTSC